MLGNQLRSTERTCLSTVLTEHHRAPASSCREREVFFLFYESGKLLHSRRGKPQGLTSSKAQKYLVARAFSASSLYLSPRAFGAQRGAAGKPGPHLSILLAEIRERKLSLPTPRPPRMAQERFCFSCKERGLQGNVRLGANGPKSSRNSKLSKSSRYKLSLKVVPYSCHL